MAKTGRFDLRIVRLARVLAAQSANGEEVESFPDPTPGSEEYFASREALSGGEQIVQGLRQSMGAMKLRIKGRAIAFDAFDRVKVKHTGEVFAVTSLYRDRADTVLVVERVHQQTTGQ